MLPSVRYFGSLLVFVQSLSIQCRNPEYLIGPLISANFRYCLFLKLFKALGMCECSDNFSIRFAGHLSDQSIHL